jgi:hypothetical protein
MSVAILQSAKYQPSSSGTSVALTLGSAPTVGNILLAITSYSQFSQARTISPPSGGTWTQIANITNGNDSIAIWWHLVVSGDGVGPYTFPISGSAEWQSGVIYEISGAYSAAPIDRFGKAGGSNPSAIPSILSDLAIAAVTYDSGSQGYSQSSGWTTDQEARPSYHATIAAHMNSLTSDTSTPISDAFSPANASIIVLIGSSAPLGFLEFTRAIGQVEVLSPPLVKFSRVIGQVEAYQLAQIQGIASCKSVTKNAVGSIEGEIQGVASCKSATKNAAAQIFSSIQAPVSQSKCPAGTIIGMLSGMAQATSLSTCQVPSLEGVVTGSPNKSLSQMGFQLTLITVITGIGVCRSPPSVPAGGILGLIQGAAACTSLSTCATDQITGATQGSFFLVL